MFQINYVLANFKALDLCWRATRQFGRLEKTNIFDSEVKYVDSTGQGQSVMYLNRLRYVNLHARGYKGPKL